MAEAPRPRVAKIISGGQTGVDRAALDAARALELPCGGWCPRGCAAEDGPIAAHYGLKETPSADPGQRTAWNVRDSDGTLILARGAPRGGTALAARCARREPRPLRVVDLSGEVDCAAVRSWLAQQGLVALNVAGPRESEAPGIYGEAFALLRRLLA